MDEALVPQGITDSLTLAAMRAVPRHEFVPADQRARAYDDTPLPIGHGQTISQPAVVAFMTQVIRPRPGLRVLEVGTGSGYQAAVLAETGARVWTVEIFRALADEARARLQRLGYDRIEVRHGESALKILLTHIAVHGPRVRADAARAAEAAGARLIVCGHSHVPFIGRDRGLTLFNPGSIGPRRFHLPIVFGVLAIAGGKLGLRHIDCETGADWSP